MVVTGSHLLESQGYTYKEIEKDGIGIFAKIPINVTENTNYGITLSMAHALAEFGSFFSEGKT